MSDNTSSMQYCSPNNAGRPCSPSSPFLGLRVACFVGVRGGELPASSAPAAGCRGTAVSVVLYSVMGMPADVQYCV